MEEYLERLTEAIGPTRAKCVNHPFVLDVQRGVLPIGKLSEFAKQDYLFLQDVYKLGSLIVLNSPDAWSQELNLSKLHEEVGHCNLLVKFAEAIGVGKKEIESAEPLPATMAITSYLFRVCTFGTIYEIGAAMGAVSSAFLEISKRMAEGLRSKYRLSAEAVEFFETHSKGMEAKHHVLDLQLVSAYARSEDDLKRAIRAASLALAYETMFFDAVYS